MTDVNETLLTAAKFREQLNQTLDPAAPVHDHAALLPPEHEQTMSFVQNAVPGFSNTDYGQELLSNFTTKEASRALRDGSGELLSYLVGVTDQDLEADEFSYVVELLDRVENNDAPLFLVGFGLPNTGKTGHILHDWIQAWQHLYPDGQFLTNASIPAADVTVTSLDELVTYCFENPDVRKFVFVDEGSTHFDARTNSHEIASQFSPFSKRFAKLSIDFATIGHTVKDVHPELKRQATTFFEKTDRKQVQFYEGYVDDQLLDPVFPEPVDGLEKPSIEYDPDDWSPLDWDLGSEKLTDSIA